MLYECLLLIVVHGLLQIGKWLSQSTTLNSLQIMHSCHQRLKHAAWVSAFKVSLQERMKGRIRSLACRARQLSWGFCESAETVASTIKSDTCACKPSRSGRTLKASCITVCLCVPNLRSSLAYKHSWCLETSSADTINCHRARLSQYLLLHADHPELLFASETCCMNVFLWSLYMDSFKLENDCHKVQFSVLCKSCIAAISV